MNLVIESLVTLQQSAPWLVLLWVAFLGGSIGSFLNVVVYRGPAKQSLLYPPSRCPKCLHAIRWYDNLPVISWLWLRGECRDCQQPIARRYPAVELFMAIAFVAMWMITLGYRTSPDRVPDLMSDFLALSVFLSVLVCHTLIAWDGMPWPRWLALWGCAVPVVRHLTSPLVAQLALAIAMAGGAILAGVMSYWMYPKLKTNRIQRVTRGAEPLPAMSRQSPGLWAGVGAMCAANLGWIPAAMMLCVALSAGRWMKGRGNRTADFRAILLLSVLAIGDMAWHSVISN